MTPQNQDLIEIKQLGTSAALNTPLRICFTLKADIWRHGWRVR